MGDEVDALYIFDVGFEAAISIEERLDYHE